MDKYINRSYLIKAFSTFNNKKNKNEHFLNGIKTAAEIVENAPIVDVAPVTHGYRISTKKHKWKKDKMVTLILWHGMKDYVMDHCV